MTLAHPLPPADDTVDRQPGPNQWFKDHLDAVIDAELLNNGSEAGAGTSTSRETGLLP